MKKNKIFIIVFLILFNYFGITYASFNLPYNDNSLISMASSKKDNIEKSYFVSLIQNAGFEIPDSNTFTSVYNEFISGLDEVKQSEFYKNAREYTVRKLFKGKSSYEKLVSEKILSNDEDWQRAFKGNMDAIFGFLNRAYHDYASNDDVEFKGNYKNFHFEVVDHYTRDLYFNDFTYKYEYDGEYHATSSFNDGYILWDNFYLTYGKKSDLKNGNLPNGFRVNNVFMNFNHSDNNHKIVVCWPYGDFSFANVDSGITVEHYSKFYGFKFKNKLTYENLLIHGYKKDDSGNVILDGNCIIVLEAPSYSFDIKKALNDSSNISVIQRCIEYQGNSSLPYKNLKGIKKVVNKSYNHTFNNPIYNTYIDNSKLKKYIGDKITYNIYNDGDLSSSIDSILSYIDSSDEYLSDYIDYLYNGSIKPNLDEISLAIDKNNNIAVDSKEIISKIDELKVDYNKIDEIVKNYTDKLYTKFINDVNSNLNDLNLKINNIDKEVQVLKENDLNHYTDIKQGLELLQSDFTNFKDSIKDLGTGGIPKDYTEDFKSINVKFDNLKNDYDSRFDNLNRKLDNLSVGNIEYTDEEKGNIKDNIFSFFDFFDKLKSFFKGFFDITESFDFSPIKNIDVKEKFPFSLPFDIVNIFKNLTSVPKVPKYDFKFLGQDLSINFSKFESLAKIVRSFSFLFFIVFLAIKTYDKFGG